MTKALLNTTFVIVCLAAIGTFHWAVGENSTVSESPDLEQAKQWIAEGENLNLIDKQTWRAMLDGAAFDILWKNGTERPFSGELLHENRDGVFVTAGCRLPVFKSEHKFKSGTGWPSFWDVFNDSNIVLKEDKSWGMRRVEVLSACGEHLGHVFEDGPEPTGLRYCINSAALAFVPSGQKDPLGPLSLE